ncbi:histidine phosphatase family protein [Spirochaetota bacterium]
MKNDLQISIIIYLIRHGETEWNHDNMFRGLIFSLI